MKKFDYEPSEKYLKLMEQYPREFQAYSEMNLKCYDPSHPEYHIKGGRGITVCERWRFDNPNGFINFMKDMGPMPSKQN